MSFADVVVSISHENLDRTFSYSIPDRLEGKVSVGDRVTIPFGKGNRPIEGFVLGLRETVDYDINKVKPILSVIRDDTVVETKLIALADWMHKRYGSTMIRSLETVFPIKKSVKNVESKTVVLKLLHDEALDMLATYEKKHQVARFRLLRELINEGSLDMRIITGKLNVSSATIKQMEAQEIVAVESTRVYRNTVREAGTSVKVTLNEKQQSIVNDFAKAYRNNECVKALLFGVTGSGKTEVYMEMIDEVIKSGRQVIVLIPEIALTYQTVMRFVKRFPGRVSTLHSKLSGGERYDQFERAKRGEIDIMIGPRSALFTPFSNVGLIVIDEEHETSYKSDNMPKYHAVEVAMELARLHKASVVLGSATPSLTSFYEATCGKLKLYELDVRARDNPLPSVSVADMRQELKSGNRSMFSRELTKKIEARLENREQVMLFLNRRGVAGFVSCRACGHVFKCPHCDISLSAHRSGKLVCHYCGYEQVGVKNCPECGSHLIGQMRAGTEAIEEKIKTEFPYARVLRMDADTTGTKDSYESILSTFANREADILVGTQMIVKGHDFPYVTLVGILAADMSLYADDYRAAERTFQLLVQASGRAGRADRKGEVVIQSYQPEHYAIETAVRQDYRAFYEQEISYRSLVGYPPVGHMLAIMTESENAQLSNAQCRSLAAILNDAIMNDWSDSGAMVIGPSEAGIFKLNDIFRYMIYCKCNSLDVLIKLKDVAEAAIDKEKNKRVRVTFDFDPVRG